MYPPGSGGMQGSIMGPGQQGGAPIAGQMLGPGIMMPPMVLGGGMMPGVDLSALSGMVSGADGPQPGRTDLLLQPGARDASITDVHKPDVRRICRASR